MRGESSTLFCFVLALSIGCGGRTRPETCTDTFCAEDRAPDAGQAQCRVAEDCKGLSPLSSVPACEGESAYSCIAGRCVWDCRSGRSCEVQQTNGSLCIDCHDGRGLRCAGRGCEVAQNFVLFARNCVSEFTTLGLALVARETVECEYV